MMERVLEPELMDDPDQVAAYARADFSDSNRWYVERLLATSPGGLRSVVDLGCGPADVAVLLASRAPGAQITAVDGSAEMLRHAQRAVAQAGVGKQVTLLRGRVCVPQGSAAELPLPAQSFDAVLSKDFLHHLPDPMALWTTAKRLGRPGAAVFVMDLVRPETPNDARAIVGRVAGHEHPLLQQDFFYSLCAAFTPAELRAQLAAAGLPLEVTQATERHVLVHGTL